MFDCPRFASGSRPRSKLRLDPFFGDSFADGGLSRSAVPRHSATLAAASSNFNPKNTLPGSVNVSFADNHVENVRLERLGQLIWHAQWVPPAKRPGT